MSLWLSVAVRPDTHSQQCPILFIYGCFSTCACLQSRLIHLAVQTALSFSRPLSWWLQDGKTSHTRTHAKKADGPVSFSVTSLPLTIVPAHMSPRLPELNELRCDTMYEAYRSLLQRSLTPDVLAPSHWCIALPPFELLSYPPPPINLQSHFLQALSLRLSPLCFTRTRRTHPQTSCALNTSQNGSRPPCKWETQSTLRLLMGKA